MNYPFKKQSSDSLHTKELTVWLQFFFILLDAVQSFDVLLLYIKQTLKSIDSEQKAVFN